MAGGDIVSVRWGLDMAAAGEGALDRLNGEAVDHMADFNRDARRLYANFMALVG